MIKVFELIPHTADLAVRIFGNGLTELFQNSLICLRDILGEKYKTENEIFKEKFCIEAENYSELLIGFLREIFYRFEVEKLLASEFRIIKLTENHLSFLINYKKILNFKKKNQIKAITYHNISIKKQKDGLSIDIVMDL